jgi:hypothetical protein
LQCRFDVLCVKMRDCQIDVCDFKFLGQSSKHVETFPSLLCN